MIDCKDFFVTVANSVHFVMSNGEKRVIDSLLYV